jgi:hypothetical protein
MVALLSIMAIEVFAGGEIAFRSGPQLKWWVLAHKGRKCLIFQRGLTDTLSASKFRLPLSSATIHHHQASDKGRT